MSWADRCVSIIAAVYQQAKADGVSYEELRQRINAAYPLPDAPGQRRNRQWRRVAHWYLSVYAGDLRRGGQ